MGNLPTGVNQPATTLPVIFCAWVWNKCVLHRITWEVKRFYCQASPSLPSPACPANQQCSNGTTMRHHQLLSPQQKGTMYLTHTGGKAWKSAWINADNAQLSGELGSGLFFVTVSWHLAMSPPNNSCNPPKAAQGIHTHRSRKGTPTEVNL